MQVEEPILRQIETGTSFVFGPPAPLAREKKRA
jgi:hypothetical protein